MYLANIKHRPPQPLHMLLKAPRAPQKPPTIPKTPSSQPPPNLLHSHHWSCQTSPTHHPTHPSPLFNIPHMASNSLPKFATKEKLMAV